MTRKQIRPLPCKKQLLEIAVSLAILAAFSGTSCSKRQHDTMYERLAKASQSRETPAIAFSQAIGAAAKSEDVLYSLWRLGVTEPTSEWSRSWTLPFLELIAQGKFETHVFGVKFPDNIVDDFLIRRYQAPADSFEKHISAFLLHMRQTKHAKEFVEENHVTYDVSILQEPFQSPQ